MQRVSFRECYDLRLGTATIGFVGEYGIANKRPNRSARAPISMFSPWTCRPDIYKIFLHPNQIFVEGISRGDALSMMDYCFEYDSFPPGTKSTTSAPAGHFRIIIELSAVTLLTSVAHSPIGSGKIQVGIGMNLEPEMILAMEITPESSGQAQNINESGRGAEGKIITIEGFDLDVLPYLDFVVPRPIPAMPDKLVQGVENTVGDLLTIRVPFEIDGPNEIPYQFRLITPRVVMDLDVSKVAYPSGLRLEPAFPDSMGWRLDYDHSLAQIKVAERKSVIRMHSYTQKMQDNPVVLAGLVKRIVARYGYQKGLGEDFDHKVDTKTPYIDEGKEKFNQVRIGDKMTRYYWPDEIPTDSPYELSRFMVAIRKAVDQVDPTATLYSPSIRIDRDFLYLFIRYCRKHGPSPYNRICLHLESAAQVQELYGCLMLLSSYETGMPVVVKISASIPNWQIPGLTHLLAHWNVSEVVVMGYPGLFNGDDPKPGWYGIFDTWYRTIREMPITRVQLNDRTVRVIYRNRNEDYRYDCIMPSFGVDSFPVVNGTPLKSPRLIQTRGVVKHGKTKKGDG